MAGLRSQAQLWFVAPEIEKASTHNSTIRLLANQNEETRKPKTPPSNQTMPTLQTASPSHPQLLMQPVSPARSTDSTLDISESHSEKGPIREAPPMLQPLPPPPHFRSARQLTGTPEQEGFWTLQRCDAFDEGSDDEA